MTEPLADDAVFAVTGATGVSGGHRGVDGVRAHMERFGSHIEPGPRMNVVELVGEGVYGGMPVRGHNALTKELQHNNGYAFVFKFDGRKIR